TGAPPTTTTSTSTTTTTLAPPPLVLVQTTSLSLRDRTVPPTPSSRKVSFKSSTKQDPTANRIVVPSVGGPGDPTLHGGTLVVYSSAGSGEKATATLPASGWRVLGKTTAPTGYKFTGSDPNGPVSRVTVKADQVRVRGGKANWTYTLNEASQG